ncbi:conserved hypothetical protein [Perkinsus marinus ATCC 50983]|uniref:PCI domain-containing protein n=1 Tax=Perkinsus marinus (strain ATCC 50983 / TXsc) TaxID=423536 RepID=C5L0N6_PERM5|nr:conserved hypothetical protein [Perkinsus marinus ATCC 50983]EER09688.1 conserved hypothetical protein [Perkinsus marinus ATCC 50983]|eukprot:XP_002777893.1 conserved hypothetical protein [Perkinsus marinus ATCC 50983]
MDEVGGLQLLGVVLSELFRYSVIYLNGGVYFDIDTRCKESIEDLLRPSDDLVFSFGNMPTQQVSQWGFAASPRNPILRELFETAIEKILSHDEGRGIPKRIDEFVSMELMDRTVKKAVGVASLHAGMEYKTNDGISVRVLPQDGGEHWNGRVDFKYGGYEKDLKNSTESPVEKQRVCGMFNVLPAAQQEQVRQHVQEYAKTLNKQQPNSTKKGIALYQFWKTMVYHLYEHAVEQKQVRPPRASPPPAAPQQQAAVVASTSSSPQQSTPQSVYQPQQQQQQAAMYMMYQQQQQQQAAMAYQQAWYNQQRSAVGGPAGHYNQPGAAAVIQNAMKNKAAASQHPPGMLQWVQRLYASLGGRPSMSQELRTARLSAADTVVKEITNKLKAEGTYWTTDWNHYPVPPERDIDARVDPKLWEQEATSLMVPSPKRSRRGGSPKKKSPSRRLSGVNKKGQANKRKGKLQAKAKKGAISMMQGATTQEELRRRQQRMERFKADEAASSSSVVGGLWTDDANGSAAPRIAPLDVNFSFGVDESEVFDQTVDFVVVGTCQKMEKSYLRLTSQPDPSLVRPPAVLKKWMEHLREFHRSKSRDWEYIGEQLKDLTVQNMKDEFTRSVYEANARWALEAEDLGQFNQCQTQLKYLYAAEGANDDNVTCEFLCYRLLYYSLQSLRADEMKFLRMLTSEQRHHPYVVFAKRIRQAMATNDYKACFRLVRIARRESSEVDHDDEEDGEDSTPRSIPTRAAPTHAYHLLRLFLQRLRLKALRTITKAYQTYPVGHLVEVLDFTDVKDASTWLIEHGLTLKTWSDGEAHIQCKPSHAAICNHPGSRPPYHLKHPKQYFDFKTFRNMLKHKKQTMGRAEKRIIKRVYAKPPPSDDWDVLRFLQEMEFGENAEEVASCFEDWSDFISSDYEDVQRVEMAPEQRRKLLVYLRKFNHGVWPIEEYQERFKGTPLENEGKPWTEEDDKKLVELAEVYDINFGDPWIYLSYWHRHVTLFQRKRISDLLTRQVDINCLPTLDVLDALSASEISC